MPLLFQVPGNSYLTGEFPCLLAFSLGNCKSGCSQEFPSGHLAVFHFMSPSKHGMELVYLQTFLDFCVIIVRHFGEMRVKRIKLRRFIANTLCCFRSRMVKYWISLIQQITCIVPWILGFGHFPFISPHWQNFVLSDQIQLIHASEGLVEGSLFPVSISRTFPPNHGKSLSSFAVHTL